MASRHCNTLLTGPIAPGSATRLARRLFELAREQSHADQQLIFRATAKALGSEPDGEQAMVIAAVREADKDVAFELSRAAYARWQRKQVAVGRVDLPSAGQAARAFGNSWQRVRAAVRGEALPVADVHAALLVTTDGGGGGEEDTLEAIRVWWRTSDKTAVNYASFQTCVRERVSAALGEGRKLRLRYSREWITKAFGSWKGAVERAGILPELSWQQRVALANTAVRYSDAELIEKLRQVVASAGQRGIAPAAITHDTYIAERVRMQRAAAVRGLCLDLPTHSLICSRLGTFGQAMTQAGLWTQDVADARLRLAGRWHPLEQIKRFVLRAAVAVAAQEDQAPASLSWRQYLRWREAVAEAENTPIPHPLTVTKRLGLGFPEAVQLAVSDSSLENGSKRGVE